MKPGLSDGSERYEISCALRLRAPLAMGPFLCAKFVRYVQFFKLVLLFFTGAIARFLFWFTF